MLGFGIAWSSGGFLLVLEFLFYCSRSKYEAYMNSGLGCCMGSEKLKLMKSFQNKDSLWKLRGNDILLPFVVAVVSLFMVCTPKMLLSSLQWSKDTSGETNYEMWCAVTCGNRRFTYYPFSRVIDHLPSFKNKNLMSQICSFVSEVDIPLWFDLPVSVICFGQLGWSLFGELFYSLQNLMMCITINRFFYVMSAPASR
ncbi:transmembrane protein, putative [Medicago truncatula]|uniref:Transmembrane protein, putative n=1 Tax=Medicago truncatula TaxID=3880 RepID=A0A072TH63_MEDTR|nr:transmembrane protein, putative [Medicago truncatula]